MYLLPVSDLPYAILLSQLGAAQEICAGAVFCSLLLFCLFLYLLLVCSASPWPVPLAACLIFMVTQVNIVVFTLIGGGTQPGIHMSVVFPQDVWGDNHLVY